MTEYDDDGKYKEGDFRVPPGELWEEKAFVRIKEMWSKHKITELWQHAVFRWCAYQVIWIGILGFFFYLFVAGSSGLNPSEETILLVGAIVGPTLITVWVWRKPIWKLVKQALGFLNKKAEED